jgi:hypothetical protein
MPGFEAIPVSTKATRDNKKREALNETEPQRSASLFLVE